VYNVIAEPPLLEGAVNGTKAVVAPDNEAVPIVGAPGTPYKANVPSFAAVVTTQP
jgi:hypothetical protein